VINVPLLLHEWQLHRAATEGVLVQATVVAVGPSGSNTLVTFRLPASVDPSQTDRSAVVDPGSGAAAARTHEIEVRVLSGHPSVFHVDGQVRSWSAIAVAVVADLMVLVLIAFSLRLGGRLKRPSLVAVALGDARAGDEGSLLDKQEDGTYVINGEVRESDAAAMVLGLRDRDVTVRLEGHLNPVEVGGRAQVRASLVG
jgi:hypothetical protein